MWSWLILSALVVIALVWAVHYFGGPLRREKLGEAPPLVLDEQLARSLHDGPEFEEFRDFFGSFHEDWDLDAPDEEGMVSLYLGHASEDDVGRLQAQIDDVLGLGLDDEELSDVFRVVYCNYLPADHAQWLREMRERLDRPS